LIDEFLQAVEDGLAGGRNPRENVRALRGALSYVDSELGTMDIQDVRRRHIQALLDQLRSSGLADARIHSVVDALHALYAYALQRDLVGFSPVVELELPQSQNGVAHTENGVYSENGVPHAYAPPDAGARGGTSGDLWTAPPPASDPWTPPPYSPPTAGDPWTPPPHTPPTVGDPWTPPPYTAPPFSQPPFAVPPPPPQQHPYGPPGYPSDGFAPPYQQTTPPYWAADRATGFFSSTLGAVPPPNGQAQYDATMQERWLWWTVRIVVIVFVLIALVLVAESV
jgi:hypothetical protein